MGSSRLAWTAQPDPTSTNNAVFDPPRSFWDFWAFVISFHGKEGKNGKCYPELCKFYVTRSSNSRQRRSQTFIPLQKLQVQNGVISVYPQQYGGEDVV